MFSQSLSFYRLYHTILFVYDVPSILLLLSLVLSSTSLFLLVRRFSLHAKCPESLRAGQLESLRAGQLESLRAGQHLIAMAASISFLKDAPVSATSPATAAAPSANSVVLDACPALTPPLSSTHITQIIGRRACNVI